MYWEVVGEQINKDYYTQDTGWSLCTGYTQIEKHYLLLVVSVVILIFPIKVDVKSDSHIHLFRIVILIFISTTRHHYINLRTIHGVSTETEKKTLQQHRETSYWIIKPFNTWSFQVFILRYWVKELVSTESTLRSHHDGI